MPSPRLTCRRALLCSPAAGHRMWALQRLRKLLTTEYGQSININRLLGDSEGETRSMVRPAHSTRSSPRISTHARFSHFSTLFTCFSFLYVCHHLKRLSCPPAPEFYRQCAGRPGEGPARGPAEAVRVRGPHRQGREAAPPQPLLQGRLPPAHRSPVLPLCSAQTGQAAVMD